MLLCFSALQNAYVTYGIFVVALLPKCALVLVRTCALVLVRKYALVLMRNCALMLVRKCAQCWCVNVHSAGA